jgi:hypothetical protein
MSRIILQESDLPSKLNSIKGTPTPVYILFSSTTTQTTGERWCGDCSAADPILQEAWEKAPASALLIEVQITRDRWKVSPGKDHPFRQEPFKVRGIPTLIDYDAIKERVKRRLVDLEQLEVLTELFSTLPEAVPTQEKESSKKLKEDQ